MERDAQIVIGPDGCVLAATGALPPGLLDAQFEDCTGLSLEVRDAGRALLDQLRHARSRIATQTVALDGGGRTVQLIAIEALAVRRTATNLRALMDQKLGVLSSQAATAAITLTVLVDDALPALVHVDSERLAWAVTTLVGNAIRYVQAGAPRKPGGRIIIRIGFDSRTSEVTIEVQDNGPGIPVHTVARLFTRDLNVQGAGLALLMTRDICAAHGGGLEVRSSIAASDHGTAVRLTVPTWV